MDNPDPAGKKHPLEIDPQEQPIPKTPIKRTNTSTFSASRSLSLNNIGIFIDRWADVIEGKADLADTIRASVLQTLQEKQMPDVRIEPINASAGFLTNENRPYIITTTSPGVTTAIYIARHGKDLYVSWRTHVRGVLNKRLLLILAAIALLPTLCASPCLFLANLASSISTPFGGGGVNVGSALVPIITVGGGFFIFELLVVAAWGYFLRGDFLAFFFVEPTIFDAEDVAAMSISVHKAIQDAVQKAGIEASILRAKPEFRGGRKSEQI